MQIRHLLETEQNSAQGKLVACFGGAQLIECRRGKWRLEGGSRSDRLEAREFISLFMHEVVVQEDI